MIIDVGVVAAVAVVSVKTQQSNRLFDKISFVCRLAEKHWRLSAAKHLNNGTKFMIFNFSPSRNANKTQSHTHTNTLPGVFSWELEHVFISQLICFSPVVAVDVVNMDHVQGLLARFDVHFMENSTNILKSPLYNERNSREEEKKKLEIFLVSMWACLCQEPRSVSQWNDSTFKFTQWCAFDTSPLNDATNIAVFNRKKEAKKTKEKEVKEKQNLCDFSWETIQQIFLRLNLRQFRLINDQ